MGVTASRSFRIALLCGCVAVAGVASAVPVRLTGSQAQVEIDQAVSRLTMMSTGMTDPWIVGRPAVLFDLDTGDEAVPTDASLILRDDTAVLTVTQITAAAGPLSIRLPITFDLAGDTLRVEIGELSGRDAARVRSFEFPNRLSPPAGSGYWVIPNGIGCIRPFDWPTGSLEAGLFADGCGFPDMPVWGAVLAPNPGQRGTMAAAIVGTPFDARFIFDGRSWSVRWLVDTRPDELTGVARHLQVNYARRIQFRLMSNASYVDLAKWYRDELDRRGVWMSLRERATSSPELVQQLGGLYDRRTLTNSFDAGAPAEARALGVRRATVFCSGWNRDGPGRLYPDRLPPNPSLRGSPDASTSVRLRGAAMAAQMNGVELAPEDDYGYCSKDVLPLMGIFLDEGTDGGVMSTVTSSGESALLVCTRRQAELANREMSEIVRLFGRGAYLLRSVGSEPLHCCFSASHPMTRADDANYRRQLVLLTRRIAGTVHTVGLPSYLAEAVDGACGLSVPSGDPQPAWNGIPVPLLPLVYHGSVILWGFRGADPNTQPLLDEALSGALAEGLTEPARTIAAALGDTLTFTMEDHQFLAPGLESSRFADGTVVVINRNDEPQSCDGGTVPAHGFIVLQGNQTTRTQKPVVWPAPAAPSPATTPSASAAPRQ